MKDYLKNIKDKRFLISIFCYMGLQALTYVGVKYLQTNSHFFNHEIDNMIPFIPQMIYIYNMFYPAVFIAFYNSYNHDKETYYKGILAGILGFIVADIIFLIYSVDIVRPILSNYKMDPVTFFIINTTYKLDTPTVNCFPSIHCLFSFQSIATLLMCKNYKGKDKYVLSILLVLIIASTVLVKQHYFMDIVGAFIVCLVVNIIGIIIFNYFKKKKPLVIQYLLK